jgi:hypothetical protein
VCQGRGAPVSQEIASRSGKPEGHLLFDNQMLVDEGRVESRQNYQFW